MKIAVIVTEVGRSIGGRFTFQEMIVSSISRMAGETRHDFRLYNAGFNRYTEGSWSWRVRRLLTVGTTLALRAAHDLQDQAIGTRVVRVRPPLERRLVRDGMEVVWFPTYIEDVDLPFVCQVFDLEHRMKPWFPEVSSHGEWEHRERHYRRYLPKATGVIVAGETGREQVVRFYGVQPENCLVLPHPTPDFALDAAAHPRMSAEVVRALGVKSPYLLYPAQFWAHKNHAAVLDVLAAIRARGHDMHLVLVGSEKGQLEHVRAQIDDRDLNEVVTLLGYVEEENLVALYQQAHALVYLSRFGPENLPPLEAFALGCPAIVADVPGADDQLGNAALIVDPFNTAAVADAIERLLDPAERKEHVEAGRIRAQSWTADDYLRGLIDFLDTFERERRLWR